MPGVLEEQRGGERGYSGGDEKERRGGRCQREDRHRSIRSEGEWGISSGSLVAPVLSAMGRKPPPAVSRPSGFRASALIVLSSCGALPTVLCLASVRSTSACVASSPGPFPMPPFNLRSPPPSFSLPAVFLRSTDHRRASALTTDEHRMQSCVKSASLTRL